MAASSLSARAATAAWIAEERDESPLVRGS